MGVLLMKKMMAVTGPPRHGKTHYMGLNLGIFSRITRNTGPNLLPLESGGFTGVFLGGYRDNLICDSPPRVARSRSDASSDPLLWRVLIRATPLIRRGGAPSGAAALLARGGVGATAPTISPPCNPDHTAQKFSKSLGQEPPIPENDRSGSGTFQKNPDTLLNVSKKFQEGYRDFAKTSDNVIELPQKRPPTLSNFSKIIWQRYRSFQKKFV